MGRRVGTMSLVPRCVDIASICVVAVCYDTALGVFRCHGWYSLYPFRPCLPRLFRTFCGRTFWRAGAIG